MSTKKLLYSWENSHFQIYLIHQKKINDHLILGSCTYSSNYKKYLLEKLKIQSLSYGLEVSKLILYNSIGTGLLRIRVTNVLVKLRPIVIVLRTLRVHLFWEVMRQCAIFHTFQLVSVHKWTFIYLFILWVSGIGKELWRSLCISTLNATNDGHKKLCTNSLLVMTNSWWKLVNWNGLFSKIKYLGFMSKIK